MDRQLKKKIKELRRQLEATKEIVVGRELVGREPVGEMYNVNWTLGVADHDMKPVYKDVKDQVPDEKRRSKARDELYAIYEGMGYSREESRALIYGRWRLLFSDCVGKIESYIDKINKYGEQEDSELEIAVFQVETRKEHLTDDYVLYEEEYDSQGKIVERPTWPKREEALKNLKEAMESNEFYSARFKAYQALEENNIPISDWTDDLEKRLKSTKNSQEIISEPDTEKRLKAVHDAAKLYGFLRTESPAFAEHAVVLRRMLKTAYHSNIGDVAIVAGRALKMSKLRIYLHNKFGKGQDVILAEEPEAEG